MGWEEFEDKLDGVALVKHAVLTVGGTWEPAPGTQYPSWVIANLGPDQDLVYEVPVPYPATFGPVGGSITAPSYEQSVAIAVDWIKNWVIENHQQTFILAGYSQGGEVVSKVLLWLQGEGSQYYPNLVGGYTFGNPCRGVDFHAPSIANPGEGTHGISSVLLTELPTVNGTVVWADYVHSKANGDAGSDMYADVPGGQIATVMADVYSLATQLQMNDFLGMCQAMLQDLLKTVEDSGVLSSLSGGLGGLLGLGGGAMITFLLAELGGKIDPNATGTNADVMAAVVALQFMTAVGGPTGPHISYGGEIGGYSNQVAQAADFLRMICELTPARSAA